MPDIPPEAKRGRLYVAIAIGLTLVGDGVVIAMTVGQTGASSALSSFIRWILTVALFYAIWRGHRWARWLVVGLLALGLLLTLPLALQMFHVTLLTLCVQFAVALGLLAFPPSVAAFQRFQRERVKVKN